MMLPQWTGYCDWYSKIQEIIQIQVSVRYLQLIFPLKPGNSLRHSGHSEAESRNPGEAVVLLYFRYRMKSGTGPAGITGW
jgi:hypothetical protein